MQQHSLSSIEQFLKQLKNEFDGDIDGSDAAQQVYATDNSIYRQIPQVIVYPKHQKDVQYIMQLAAQAEYRHLVITPRGGGTGTNGQSLTDGIVVDLSRHMNQILHIDPQRRTATVQAGVVKDQLNAALKPHGLFFAPELSTSNRATIGGMINTDASGQGSCRYGKTHHHVIALKTVILQGEILESEALTRQNWQQGIANKSKLQQNIYHDLFSIAVQNKQLIKESFPDLNRSLTGYDLPHLLDEQTFNMNNILCGSEGTLGFVVEATLNVLPIPAYRLLINIGYAGFEDALRDANALMALQPLSIETVDSKVLNLAKNDIVWQNVAQYFPETGLSTPIEGINLVEIDAVTEQALEELKQQFLQHLKQDQSVVRLTTTVAVGGTEIGHVYAMRKRAVGLLGNVQGEKRPQPFVEDTAVPPQHLANYISDFRKLLDQEGLDYGMFGHVDAGVLHVRPALDMKDPASLERMKKITDQVVELTHHYGGVLWGEHGKGLRSEYAPIFFGQTYPLIQKVKALFDPHNQLNPGKIATPATIKTARLIGLTEIGLRGDADRQVAQQDWQEYGSTMHCNGNGTCFNYDLDDPMCPSYKVTRDRIHSPKGRATLIKEWLRREHQGEQDTNFDQQVYSALHGCLSCKSCAGQCPVKVDIPDAKARFLQRYHQRHGRSIRDYLISNLESFIPKLVPMAGLYNLLQRLTPTILLQRQMFKLVDIPLFHPQAKADLAKYGAIVLNADLSNFPEHDPREKVIIVQDAFTRYFETSVFLDMLALIVKLGMIPCILPYMANGKPLHVHGFLDQFEQKRQQNIQLLQRAAAFNVPLIGIDPAMTLVYRQEYKSKLTEQTQQNNAQVGSEQEPSYQVLMVQEWLAIWLKDHPLPSIKHSALKYYLASHCTEKTQSPVSIQQWQDIFQDFGLELEVLALGCCGMAGTYGHEAEHRALSEQIYQQSWQEKISQHQQQVLATGYSCRTQVKRLHQQSLKHPIQVLKTCLEHAH